MTPPSYSPGRTALDVLDYGLDWASWLAVGETLSTVTVSASPSDPSLILGAPGVAGSVTTVWISGGTEGTTYLISFDVTTSAGRTAMRSAYLRCGVL